MEQQLISIKFLQLKKRIKYCRFFCTAASRCRCFGYFDRLQIKYIIKC